MRCVVEYLGTAYAGFQRQPGKVTVQSTLEQALRSITGENVAMVGSGRTDAGAHALGQVVAFTTTSSLPAAVIGRAMNATLPSDIAVVSASEVEAGFHPRFDAHARVYRYLIWNRPVRSPLWHGRAAHVKYPLDTEAMHDAAQQLLGRHDLGAFVPRNLAGSRIRTVYRASCRRDGELVAVELEADGFMRQMVRAIAGTLIRVGGGRITSADFERILASRDRKLAGPTAPAAGLYLVAVEYQESPRHTLSQHTRAGQWTTPGVASNSNEEQA